MAIIYPVEVIREALLNSIVHREYNYSASTLIRIFDDRMEFVTIGGLPKEEHDKFTKKADENGYKSVSDYVRTLIANKTDNITVKE